MKSPLRVIVADDEPDMLEYLEKTFPQLGHEVVASARTGRELVDLCRVHRPDLIVTDIRMPEMDGIEAATEINRTAPIPVILISAYHDTELVERAESDHILAYLVKPISQPDLPPAIGVAMRRFAEFQELQKEVADLREALEARKLIERAKGILMKRWALSEEEAFQRLQKMAKDKRSKLAEVARMILDVEGACSLSED